MTQLAVDAALMTEFTAWRKEVDCAEILSDFDLALGWFTGKGCTHDEALEAAIYVRDVLGGTP
jgi:hypothetical protein